jgi:uncharacterized membrane protein (DUF106 family)
MTTGNFEDGSTCDYDCAGPSSGGFEDTGHTLWVVLVGTFALFGLVYACASALHFVLATGLRGLVGALAFAAAVNAVFGVNPRLVLLVIAIIWGLMMVIADRISTSQ